MARFQSRGVKNSACHCVCLGYLGHQQEALQHVGALHDDEGLQHVHLIVQTLHTEAIELRERSGKELAQHFHLLQRALPQPALHTQTM